MKILSLSSQVQHIIPDLDQWPITKFYNSRTEFIEALNNYVYDRIVEKNDDLRSLLEKTIYLEIQRTKSNPWKVDPSDDKSVWSKFGQQLSKASTPEEKEAAVENITKRIINRYAEEIVGGFSPKTFKFARKFLTSVFKRLFNSMRFPYLFKAWGKKEELLEKVNVTGKIEELRSLFQKGTVILVPNHFSNLDSILLGYAIDFKVGIPAFTWGAGLNLFDYEILAHYMNRLGTYRVDRRKRNPIYLETLKGMSSLSQHFGLNNIFFPGGTRSRSGAMEQKLKYGLLQSTIEAQRLNLMTSNNRKIFIVPVVLGYHFVLEAQGLIEQHLRATGREKYTKIKVRESRWRRIWVSISNLMSKGTDVRIHFCQALDVVGNKVDIEGRSIDQTGQEVDLKEYFQKNEEVNKDRQREKIYTQVLSEKIIESYFRENIILSSHLVSFVAFELLRNSFPELSIFEFVNKTDKELELSKSIFVSKLQTVIDQLIEKENLGLITLSEVVKKGSEACLTEGLSKIGLFHPKKPLYLKTDQLLGSQNIKLLYFYRNRLEGFEIEDYIQNERALIKQ